MDSGRFNKIFSRLTSHGWLSSPEGQILIKYAEKTEGPIVEVGSYQGRSTVLLAHLERPVYAIDPWDDDFNTDVKGEVSYQKFLANIKNFPNVIPVRMKVEDWTPIPAGFVYLDGDHTYEGTRRQIEKALACNPKYIAMHDVNDRGDGVFIKQAGLEMLGVIYDQSEKMAIWKR